MILSGPCPRCREQMEHWEPLFLARAFRGVDRVTAAREAMLGLKRADILPTGSQHRDVPMVCACATEHPGAPDSRSGCGAHWIVTIDFDL